MNNVQKMLLAGLVVITGLVGFHLSPADGIMLPVLVATGAYYGHRRGFYRDWRRYNLSLVPRVPKHWLYLVGFITGSLGTNLIFNNAGLGTWLGGLIFIIFVLLLGHQAYWLIRTQTHEVWMNIMFELGSDGRLPERYRKVLENEMSSPISLYLRWPLPTIPRVGEHVSIYNLGMSRWVVNEVNYALPYEDASAGRTYIRIELDNDEYGMTLTEIFGLCEMSVQEDAIDRSPTLADTLRQAGLATTWEEYETERSRQT